VPGTAIQIVTRLGARVQQSVAVLREVVVDQFGQITLTDSAPAMFAVSPMLVLRCTTCRTPS